MTTSHRLMWMYWRIQSQKNLSQFSKCSQGREINRIFRRCLSSLTHQPAEYETNLICDGIIRSPFPDIIPFHTTVDQLLWTNIDRWSDYTAMECSITGQKYTFHQLRVLSGRFAASLRKQGLNPGDVLSVMLPNVPDYPIIVLGAMEAGIVVSPINPIYTSCRYNTATYVTGSDELSHQLGDNNSVAVLTLPEFTSKVNEAKLKIESKTNTQFPLRTIVVKYNSSESLPADTINYFDMISDNVECVVTKSTRKPDDIAILPYSSGTTGLPKGVELTHRNLVSNILQSADHVVGFLTSTTNDHQEVIPAILPFFHIYGLVIILFRGIFHGCKVVTISKFESTPFVSLVKDYRATVLYAVPPIITLLGNHPSISPEHFASLTHIINGAGPIAAGDKNKLYDKAKSYGNFHFVQGYGLTESSPLALVSPVYKKDFTRFVPIKSTVAKIVKEDGTIAAPSEHGEIYLRGPQVMRGYYKKPQSTKETIDDNGYLHTGDGGYYDDDGSIHIVERIKELIKVKGFQVAPAELEAILRSHPHVLDAGVIGVPDDRTGQKPLAFVVKKGQTNEQDLQNYVASKVSSYKKLARVVFVDSVPKSPSGKILRRILRDEFLKN